MRYATVCSGIGAPEYAFRDFGWECVFASEIDPFARSVYAHRYPNVPIYGDFRELTPEITGAVDLLVAGPPCFGAGTLVITKRGLLPIEEVKVGDEVITHRARWKKVSAIKSRLSETVVVKAQGTHGTVTTEGHRFYAASIARRSRRKNGIAYREVTRQPNKWVAARDLDGRYLASLQRFPATSIPAITTTGNERPHEVLDERFFWVIGAWLGDGWTRVTKRRGYVIICARKGEQSQQLAQNMRAVFGNVACQPMRTADRYSVSSRAVARWLVSHFGSGSGGKTVPTWIFGIERRFQDSFLAGYLFADGNVHRKHGKLYRASTISRRLAFGIKILSNMLGYAASVHFYKRNQTCVIEGRVVNQHDTYDVHIYERGRSSWERGRYRYGFVRSVRKSGHLDVTYDLTVEEDHSFVADGFCVHNCTDFSIAGLRKGLAGDRGALTIEFVRLLERYGCPQFLFENVPGILSANKGGAFSLFLGLLEELGYHLAWRVLDVQFFGAPQRRRRVYVVGDIRDRRAIAVLFEPGGVSWDSQTSAKAQEDIAGTLSARSSGGGGLGTDMECAGGGGRPASPTRSRRNRRFDRTHQWII